MRNIGEIYQGQLWQARDTVFFVVPGWPPKGRRHLGIDGHIERGEYILVLDAWETEFQEPCIKALYKNKEILFSCDIAHMFKLDLECNK